MAALIENVEQRVPVLPDTYQQPHNFGLIDELRTWRRAYRWHPHQWHHNAATSLRGEFGLEAAQLTLGHGSAQTTDAVYAER
ncbi:MAG: hypothetical protein KKI02_02825, partial [Planctomycetes bacterium]|nr:hypothetical protein [Planctomycetota bacterium]